MIFLVFFWIKQRKKWILLLCKGFNWIVQETCQSRSYSKVVHKLCSVKKDTKLNQVFCLFRNHFHFLPGFYLILWLMTSLNKFEKITILKKWQLVFFWGIKTYFDILPLKWCFFRHEKINILNKICHSFCPN